MGDDDIAKRFLSKKPFEDEYGLAGRLPRPQGVREILGTSGGTGSYQVDQPKLVEAPVVSSSGVGGDGAGGTTTTLTVIYNGADIPTNFVTR